MKIVPLTLKEANEFVKQHHRHHKPTVGHKLSIGVANQNKELIGAVILGRPVARNVNHQEVIEVTRLVTDGTKNACSILYAAAARVSREMGYKKIQTYILETEPGTSLRAAGWVFEINTAGGDWNRGKRKGRRTDQPQCPKQRWAKELQ